MSNPDPVTEGQIGTVLGPLPASRLGVTEAHAHLLRLGGPLVDQDDRFLLADRGRSIQEARLFLQAGGRSLIDMMPCAPGRSPELLAEISRGSGLQIVAATGFVDWALYPGTYPWLEQSPVEELAGLLAAEITQGMDAFNYTSPLVRRTPVRAGVVKISGGLNRLSSLQEKLISAGALAHRQTGAPLAAHTEKGTCGDRMLEVLLRFGVSPEALILAHTFLNPEPEYLADLASAGVYLVQDGPGKPHYGPDSEAIRRIEFLLGRGFQDRLLLAGDHSKTNYLTSYGGRPGLDYMLKVFVPSLRQAGIAEADISAMLVDNPARAFAFRPVVPL